jgi:hypothetical protein
VAFDLPKRWYRDAAASAIEELTTVFGELTRDNAWLFLYASVAWTEEIPKGSGKRYLHTNDRLSTKNGRLLAELAERSLTTYIRRDLVWGDVVDQIGKRYHSERIKQGSTEWQRNNVTGNAMESVLQILLEKLCAVPVLRTPSLNSLSGFELAPAGYHSKPDLALFGARDFRLLVSTKWTLRKERIGTYLHEAYFYKQRRPDLQVAFVVGDNNLNILKWLANDPLVDRVYHVNKRMLLDMHMPAELRDIATVNTSLLIDHNSSLAKGMAQWWALSEKIFDLAQLFEDVDTLWSDDEPEPPGESTSDEEDD